MNQKPNPPGSNPYPPAGSALAASTTKICTDCNSDDRWILHVVKIKGCFRKLCTSCVLKTHKTSFCPSCFSLHNNDVVSPSTVKFLSCLKCSSLTHPSCVSQNTPRSPFLCEMCKISGGGSFGKLFDFRKERERSGGEERRQVIDERAARVLVCAARISALSMVSASTTAKRNAETKAKEAVLARKRAKEAIEVVTGMTAKLCRRPDFGGVNGGVGGIGGVGNGFVVGGGQVVVPPHLLSNGHVHHVGSSSSNGNGNGNHVGSSSSNGNGNHVGGGGGGGGVSGAAAN